jgi:hypothetical protein
MLAGYDLRKADPENGGANLSDANLVHVDFEKGHVIGLI